MKRGWLFYFLGSLMDLFLEMFYFPEYYIVGRVARTENTRVLFIAQSFYGLSRKHAKSRFKQHTSFTNFDRIIAFGGKG